MILRGDCIEVMKAIKPNSIDLIIADPPYNIGKAKWDKIDNYIEWMRGVFLGCQRILKDNGSFYWFHNHMPTVSRLMILLEDSTDFIFKQFIVWNKRFSKARNIGYLNGYIEVNGLRNYQKMAEYLLFYTFQDETGLTTVKLDLNNFTSLRKYFKEYQGALALTKKQIVSYIGQRADHCFRWNSSQWDLPTPETYNQLSGLPIRNGFLRREYEALRREYEALRREYEALRREYEALRYTFNNQKTHHSVWNYEVAEKQRHVTPKPLGLIENIILHSSNDGDLVLDPFMGSGTTGVACRKLEREFIGIEKESRCIKIAKQWIAQPQQMEMRA